ncbi:DUF6470 family protein [Paenibacillus sp. YN15]|uniref:DUF6470 family protein n=1 Tax=Paenibacillus sp. YN15 TaxID=1742774 RepID=UPI001C65F1CD|nr:DUF6470 family protein [Paenibacillus sp. YN15]
MPSIPMISIRQEPALLGIDADLGRYDMKQPRPTLELKTTRPQISIHSPNGELQIDQSAAWDGLAIGGHLQTMNRIYSEAANVALQGVAKAVERGNRLAAIHTRANAIADIGQEEAYKFHEFNYPGPASYDNVELQYTAHKPDIQVQEGRLDVEARVNRPEVSYIRGKLDIYMQQYGKVEIIPPQIDLQM